MVELCGKCAAMIFIVSLMFCKMNEAAPVSNDDPGSVMSFQDHMQLTKDFPCSQPQLRSYNIKKSLLGEQRGIKDVIWPAFTVVRRCDERAGCCSGTAVCLPDPKETTLKFVTVKLDNLIDGTSKMRTLQIEEHQRCLCKVKQRISESKKYRKCTRESECGGSYHPVETPSMRLLDPRN